MIREKIANGLTSLGIELGSTRIKACLIDDTFSPVASGSYSWENKFENGYWTYDFEEFETGIRECFSDLRRDVSEKYSTELCRVSAIGISGMMHGYLVFDKDMNILTPFRTWRNTTTEAAARELSELFGFNIPERWSIAHLYQSILNGEEHVSKIAHLTTLSGYIHYMLTGKHEIGVNEGSGMFPFDGLGFDEKMLDKFDALIEGRNLPWKIRDILPAVRGCRDSNTHLSEEGAKFLDISGSLKPGIPVCAPEGDAGTGMIATNSIRPGTGNISAGTSVFSLLVLKKPLCGYYPEIDVCMTPEGNPTALIHSNNGCSELDMWVNMFGEFASLSGAKLSVSELYELLYKNALSGDSDCGEIISYNCLANEPISGVRHGRPMIFRTAQSRPSLANFFRSEIYASVAPLRIGMDMLLEKEGVTAEGFTAHGGLFKVAGVAQQLLANTLGTPISVSETAGEGGAWGMALLAAYSVSSDSLPLADWLDNKVFAKMETSTLLPEKDKAEDFEHFFALYKSGLSALDVF